MKQEELKRGDVVYVSGGYKNSVRIGETAIVTRKGHSAYWIKFQDGMEMVWRRAWLNKLRGENGNTGRTEENITSGNT